MNLTLEKIISIDKLIIIQRKIKENLIDGGSISDILQILSENIGEDIALLDIKMDKHYISTSAGDFSNFIMNKSEDEILNQFFSYKISHHKEIYAYLIINNLDKTISDLARVLLSLSELSILLLLQRENENLFIEKKYRNKFIQDIIYNKVTNLDKVEKMASIYGWNFSNMTAISVIVISLLSKKTMDVSKLNNFELNCGEIIKSQFPDTIYTTIGNKIVFIVSGVKNDDIFNRILENLKKKIRYSKYQDVSIGVGSKKTGILMAHQSYNEALIALKIGRKISNKKINFYSELGAYKLLASVHNSLLAEDFLKTYLNTLIKYDKENSQDLLDTVNALVNNDWDIKKVSEEQFIHYNTVKYRIKKIGDILDLDLSLLENKINIALALKLYHLND